MFDILKLQLMGEFTYERLWGLALLILSAGTAGVVAWHMAQQWIGYQQYVAAGGSFLVTLLLTAKVYGQSLDYVRKNWVEGEATA
jgi:hypothetical protein